MPDLPIRSFAMSVVVTREFAGRHEVLLLRRTRTLRGEWCQVAGAIEPGGTAWQAALREVREETVLTPHALYSADFCKTEFVTRAPRPLLGVWAVSDGRRG